MPSPHGTAGTPDQFETPTTPEPPRRRPAGVAPAGVAPELHALATRLSPLVHLGTSSWSFPGWRGLVFDAEYSPARLARHGLGAYAAHPLLRTVSLDRSFYRALPATEYAALACQVPPGFRFVVKASASVTDAVIREPGSGRPAQPNPLFLDPAAALAEVLQPVAEGLGERLGALVFQLSPLPRPWLAEPQRLLGALDRLFGQLPRPPHGVLALELRDAALLTPELAALLKAQGVRWCLGLHDRMPPIDDQLSMLRATWPGPLVCRWNLQRGLAYGEAKDRLEPFDRLQAPDPATREVLAKVIAATAAAGHRALVTVNNKAEGSAPRSVFALAEAVARHAAASAGR